MNFEKLIFLKILDLDTKKNDILENNKNKYDIEIENYLKYYEEKYFYSFFFFKI